MSECLITLKLKYNLNNNDDIFMGIMEYNDNYDNHGNYNKKNIINSTNYTLFYMNGTNPLVLNLSYCDGLKSTVEKYTNITVYPDIHIIDYIMKNYNISFPEDEEIFLDICQKFKD